MCLVEIWRERNARVFPTKEGFSLAFLKKIKLQSFSWHQNLIQNLLGRIAAIKDRIAVLDGKEEIDPFIR